MATQHPGSEPGCEAGCGVNAAAADGGLHAVAADGGLNAVAASGGLDAAAANGGLNAAVAALREHGTHRVDPVRFRFIEALARRAEGQPPAVRRRLDATLARALDEYIERYGKSVEDVKPVRSAPDRPAPGPLAGLVQQLARAPAPASRAEAARGPAGSAAAVRALAASGRAGPTPPRQAAGPGAPNELQALAYFRSTWARLAVHRSMNQSLAKTPKNAGPLNSHRLVLRALQLMQDTSPAYLNRFVSYVDALLALERLGEPAPPPAASPPPAEGEKKRRPARG